jgi:2-dehydro-3-deoxyphosphogalactonate aldolase
MTASIPWPHTKRPLVAILRGIQPDEVDAIGAVLVESGFDMIEVPLNSPDPFNSIERLVRRFGTQCLIGAGTVVRADDCNRVADAGGKLMVSPSVNAEVLAAAHARGMVTMPGVFTATEAYLALSCGASALKFFPASVLGPGGIAALRSILPQDAVLGAVGGVSDSNFGAYAAVGIRTFGLGSSLYRPGMSAEEVRKTALASIRAYDIAMEACALQGPWRDADCRNN